MKIALILFFISISSFAHAGTITYGYNAKGDYVPTEIDGKQIEYGYNARGDYVPTSVGGF